MTPHKIIPTPLAVLQACELLSRGTATQQGYGDLLAIDIGGATTDVYSMAAGTPTVDNTMLKGLPEPWAKRTVEGDLGMRYSLTHVFEQLPERGFPQYEEQMKRVGEWVERCSSQPDTLAQPDSEEEKIEEFLGRSAVALAVERHCGRIADVYTPLGLMHTLEGKDLMDIPAVVGIGGVLRNSRHPEEILKGSLYNVMQPESTRPRNPKFYLDSRYIFAAMGLLRMVDEELACELLLRETKKIG
jgi:uncharacterized protein (TIGR01319 family)